MMGYFLRGHRVTWHEFIHARRYLGSGLEFRHFGARGLTSRPAKMSEFKT